MSGKRSFFNQLAKKTADGSARPITFALALGAVVTWALTGPVFGYSDTWQLVINTSTTIITFLMVFLIQNAQNRDTRALQIKLDELLRVTEGAHTALLDLEELDDKQLEKIVARYEAIAEESRRRMKHGTGDTHIPHIEFPPEIKEEPPQRKSGSAKNAPHK